MFVKVLEMLIGRSPVLGPICSVGHECGLECPTRDDPFFFIGSPISRKAANRGGQKWVDLLLKITHPAGIAFLARRPRYQPKRASVLLASPVLACEVKPSLARRSAEHSGEPVGKNVFFTAAGSPTEDAHTMDYSREDSISPNPPSEPEAS